jgi:hypothetical protein
MYEQRNKDITKAQPITLAEISRILGCEGEDLLETESLRTKSASKKINITANRYQPFHLQKDRDTNIYSPTM